jgi:predicted ATPase/DNA-binding CsgD family transcriptional regulator
MAEIQDQRDLARAAPLTRREREILGVLAENLSVPEIAVRLMLAPSTVRSHLKHLYTKLGANSRRQAVNRARELGLFAAPSAGAPLAAPIPKHNLPLQVTRFFGREAEIAQTVARLDEHRLLTLTGFGGVGKSRLALRIAEAALPSFADGSWLVELAPLDDAALIAPQVAAGLGLRDDGRAPLLASLSAYLRDRQLLLVLDNCEHLLEPCSRLVEALLRSAPGLRVLATSREPLGSAGEAVFSVAPLACPDPDRLPPLAELCEYATVRLLIDRARLVLPDYQVTAANAASLARICRQVDGIPLAIEMAAARLSTLTAAQLADRLGDAFRLLTGGSRNALPRQQTLRATVAWSYQLLNAPERLLFQRLSVFAGGCTLEAAEAVCADPAPGAALLAAEIVNVLAALVAKSMVIAERRQGADTRYRQLEMLRQYAWDMLGEAGERDRLRRGHLVFFLAFAETVVPRLNAYEHLFWDDRMDLERENFRRALEWAFNDLSPAEAGPRLVVALPNQWPNMRENLDWCRRGLALCQSRPAIPAQLHIQLLLRAVSAAWLNNLPEALAWAQQAVAISRHLGADGQVSLIRSLEALGWTYRQLNDFDQVLAAYAEKDALLMALGPQRYPAQQYHAALGRSAVIKTMGASSQGRYRQAQAHARDAIRIYEQIDDPGGLLEAWVVHGNVCINLEEFDLARDSYLKALRLTQDWTTEWGLIKRSNTLGFLAEVDVRQGNLERAGDYCRASLRLALGIPDRNIVADCLVCLAAIEAAQSQPRRAARLSGAVQALAAAQSRQAGEAASLEALLPGWHAAPDRAAISAAFQAGQAMSAEQAVALAREFL